MSDFPKREALILFQQRYYTDIHVQCNNTTRYFRIISMKHPPPHSYSTAKYNIDILDVFLTDFNLKQNLIIRHQCQLSTLLCASLSAHVIQHKSIFHLSTPDTGCFLQQNPRVYEVDQPTYSHFALPTLPSIITVTHTHRYVKKQILSKIFVPWRS